MATWNTTATEVTWTAVDDPSVTWTVQLNPTVTGGGGAVDSVNGETGVVVLSADDVNGRDIYRPALVMSPTSVTAFGGSMVNGVSLTIAALASSIPTGADILIWNGTNGGAPNGSYTHTGSGNFTYATRQYLNATSFNNGCVEVSSNDFATTNADGEISRWAITTTNGTDYGLEATGGQAFRLTYGPSSYTEGRPAVFDATDGNWLKQGTAIGGDLATATDAGGARTVLGLGTSATYNVGTGASEVVLGNDNRLTDSRTPTNGSVTNAKVDASAAIDLSKLQTITTARLLGRSTAGTGAIEQLTAAQARELLGFWSTSLGAQTAIDNSTSGWNPGASVGSVTLPVCAAGDIVMFNAVISWVNSSGASRSPRLGVTLGTTPNVTQAGAATATGTTREFSVSGFVHVISTTSQLVSATFIADNTTTISVAAATTEDVSSAKALGLLAGSNSATGTQSATLRGLHVRRVSA